MKLKEIKKLRETEETMKVAFETGQWQT